MSASAYKRRLFPPEIIQSSAMDCGPASLWSFLAGHGVEAGYGELRDICCTDVDGTSIDTMEIVAGRFGLETEQMVIPVDHVFHDDARTIPAIVVLWKGVGATHFVVPWRRLGSWVQLMDPAAGRRWVSTRSLVRDLFVHETPMSAVDWRSWAGTEEFLGPLSDRMLGVGLRSAEVILAINEALADPGWHSIAAVDAATRLMSSLRGAAGLDHRRALRLFRRLTEMGCDRGTSAIPEVFWSARHVGSGSSSLVIRGAVVLRATGRSPVGAEHEGTRLGFVSARRSDGGPDPERARASSVMRTLLGYVRGDGLLGPTVLVLTMVVSALVAALQALLLKGVVEIGIVLGLVEQRIGALAAISALASITVLLESRALEGLLAVGRRLELRIRVDFLRKLAVLPDHFFLSRLTSDLTARIHQAVMLRSTPEVAARAVQSFFGLLFTTAGIVWLDPSCASLAVAAAVSAVALPAIANASLTEQQLTVATYQGALVKFHVDAALGAFPLRAHAARQALKTEHEEMLELWARARLKLLRTSLAVNALVVFSGMALSAAILFAHLASTRDTSSVLLLVFWAQQLPALGQTLAASALRYPAQRAVATRVLEPISGTHRVARALPRTDPPEPVLSRVGAGVSVRFHDVGLAVAGHRILDGVDFDVPAGSHCAVVGASGAGKTSLLGLLLGWYDASSGFVEIDGRPLDSGLISELRAQIAWVDSDVYLWNASLLDNLRYGSPTEVLHLAGEIVDRAELRSVIRKLPQGFNTGIGEGGALLSEGEGQRVRLGRAMLKRSARLVLMDEPFRGLDRNMRARRLAEARAWWSRSTVFCVTHDPFEALSFDQVVVVEQGRVVENGAPTELSRTTGSRFAALLAQAAELRRLFEDGRVWRRLEMRDGALQERGES